MSLGDLADQFLTSKVAKPQPFFLAILATLL
jgi:hypothetical protein